MFTHAYLLLGTYPQRFGTDLRLYLATVNAFFEGTRAVGGLSISDAGNADFRRRISEDLGVGIAAVFMVDVFGLAWESISQIPVNRKLSKMRPDFQGYSANELYLFEAKGTTSLPKVEKAMSKAVDQVKDFPVSAEAKIAVVTYLSVDDRFFPSTSFVVDPPIPSEIEPSLEASRHLHFWKVLQYAGLATTAAGYLAELSYRLAEDRKVREAPGAFLRERKDFALRVKQAEDVKAHGLEIRRYRDVEYLGREIGIESGMNLFLGVEERALRAGLHFEPAPPRSANTVAEGPSRVTSYFDDGTVLDVDVLRKSVQ